MLALDARDAGILNKRVLCAVSGGADSVALLRLLCDLRDRGEITLFAAHFEHGIRGESSLEDMRFTEALCEKLHVPLSVGHGDVPREAARAGEGMESCARRLRHAFLEQTRRALSCDVIALAHHRRDRAETVLMHLLRGGGAKGAAAMPKKDGCLVRPLIDFSPEDIRAYLNAIGQDWREDESNFAPDNPRNALRLGVFPLLRDIYPGFESALCRFSELSLREDAYMEQRADEFAADHLRCFAGVWIIKRGEEALMLRLLRRFLPDCGYGTALRALGAVHRVDLGQGYTALGDAERLFLVPPLTAPAPAELNVDGETVLDGLCRVTAAPAAPVPVRDNGCVQVVSRAALEGCVLRLWQSGDYICPFGMKGARKSVGDYFTDRHFPVALRERLPILSRGNEALWLPTLGISEKMRVNETTPAIRLTINIYGGNEYAF